jgi:hypothetical protein
MVIIGIHIPMVRLTIDISQNVTQKLSEELE